MGEAGEGVSVRKRREWRQELAGGQGRAGEGVGRMDGQTDENYGQTVFH